MTSPTQRRRTRTRTRASSPAADVACPIPHVDDAAGDVRPEADHVVAKRMLELLRAGADFRARKVRRLRAAVRVKAYENQLKLTIAVDRMRADLDRMGDEAAAEVTPPVTAE